MNFIKPEKLKPSSTVAFVSLAGSIDHSDSILTAKKYFEDKGFQVKIFAPDRNVDYLGGSDKERLSFLHDAFSDTSVEAVIALRGGYGSLRLLKDIDWNLIKNNPKIFAGFSDITALLLMIWKNTGLMTFHAPMVCSDFGADLNPVTEQNFFKTLQNGFSHADIKKSFNGNYAQGILWGGNLATIVSLCGLDFLPDEDFVFFAEDINEPVYKIDRMFTQLSNIEKFRRNIKALVIGDFNGLDDERLFCKYIKNLALSLNIPVFFGLKTGHEKEKLTLPIGLPVTITDSQIKPI